MTTTQKVAFFNTKPYEQQIFAEFQTPNIELVFFQERLTKTSAELAKKFAMVCIFVNDVADATVLEILASNGTKLIALRCAGFDNVDLEVAKKLGIAVTRVPAYSPFATSEHALALMMTLNRKTHRAYNRTREGDYSLNGLMGFDMHGKTVGIIGTGKIGSNLAKILQMGMGCKVLAYDVYKDEQLVQMGVQYVASLDELLPVCDILSLHVPLLPETKYMINVDSIAKMKTGVMLINTSRGALLDTKAVIHALKQKKIGALGVDVYENEQGLFFEDKRNDIMMDDTLARLSTFPNVLVTAHQAFFTREAVKNIAEQTIASMTAFATQSKIEDKFVLVKM